MFPVSTYTARRQTLQQAERLSSGLVLLLGNQKSPMTSRDNPYPFRQDSTFLYYFGLDEPDLIGVIDLDAETTRLYGDDPTLDEIVWMGDRPALRDLADRAGIPDVSPRSTLPDDLDSAIGQGRRVHVLPPYREAHYRQLGELLGLPRDRVDAYTSEALVRAVIEQRSRKSEEEIEQIEGAIKIASEMHETAMRMCSPGVSERTIAGRLSGIAETEGRGLSFRPTCSIHGEVLHNHEYSNRLQEDDLLLVDAGAAGPKYYTSDITRVTPVDGTFSSRQTMLYEAVHAAQIAAIDAIEPDVPFRRVHRRASRVLTEALKNIGLIRGPVEDAVDEGAHALFFPHGLGHMLGLDPHDMESLGEDLVGYADDQERSEQFGLHTLRLARPLEPGHVLTVEPGCYFIPALIRQWRQEDRHAEYIDYDTVAEFEGIGGIRIEDDVLVTQTGCRVLGPDIPKSIEEVQEVAGRNQD